MRKRVQRTLDERPYEFFASLAFAIGGILQLVLVEVPPSILLLLGNPLAVLWTVYLTIGGLATLTGLVAHRGYWERAGLTVSGTAALVYAFAIFAELDGSYIIRGATVLAIAAAHLVRASNLRRETRGAGRA